MVTFLISCTPAVSDQKTDATARLAIRYLNDRKPDSIYELVGEAFKKRLPPAAWASVYTKQLSGLLPLENMTLVSQNDSLSIYKVDLNVSLNGKIATRPFQFEVGALDKYGKISSIALHPYAETSLKAEKAPKDNKMVSYLDTAVDRVVSPYIQTKGNVGISVAVWYKGKSFFYNYGERKIGSKILPNNHTLYDIGSVTKTFTSTLLAIAVQQRLLTLETPIAKFLPDSVAENQGLKNIIFKQLANHTSGLPRDVDNFGPAITDANQPFGNYSINMLYSFLKDYKLGRDTLKYEYSNLGVGLMGAILETVFHNSYRNIVRGHITSRLGMNETVIEIDTTKFKNLAQGYNLYYQPVPFYLIQAMEPAGAVKSSTYDLIAYAKAQLSSRNDRLDSAIRLTHKVSYEKGSNKIGLGWQYLDTHKNVLNHEGGTGGYFSSICIDLDEKIAVVILTNNTSNGHLLGKKLIVAIQAMNPQSAASITRR
ncbi:MAG: serine hydrolase domain-containing protein [Pedobacter sp.]